ADPLERLEKLANLKEKGILTDEEFLQVKSRLVKKLTEEEHRSNNITNYQL
ncbi:MAG: SHOCT domain-containing protein, partial [Thermoproteota archaeon]|nr:SHOCT domain-containing protein [Thermoproteota archaeon]